MDVMFFRKLFCIALISLASVFFVGLCFALDGTMTMYIYNSSEAQNIDPDNMGAIADEMPDGASSPSVALQSGQTTSVSLQDKPCSQVGDYYGAVIVTGEQPHYNANGISCNGISGDYKSIYNCFLYNVTYDENEEFCKRGNDGNNIPCFGDSGGIWEPNVGDGECCGDDTTDDPDMGKLSCLYCPNGLSPPGSQGESERDWMDAVNSISAGNGCCGDDLDDCTRLVSNKRYLCWDFQGTYSTQNQATCPYTNPERCQTTDQSISYVPGNWQWADAVGSTQGKILNVSCANITVVSNGNTWLGCNMKSFEGTTAPVAQPRCIFSISEGNTVVDEIAFEPVSPEAIIQ